MSRSSFHHHSPRSQSTKTATNDIHEYFQVKRLELETLEKNPSVEQAQISIKQLEFAQLLCSIGEYAEAKKLLTNAFQSFKIYQNTPLYTHYAYNCGVTYATVLEYLNEVDTCESVYLYLDNVKPQGYHLGEFAYFLHRRKKDFDRAEVYYKRALEFFPEHSSIHLKYAGFLRHVRRNLTGAQQEYLLAVNTGPENADALGNYASFLHGVNRMIDEAEFYYKKAAQVDDTHANNLCNYGLFLSEEREKFAEAEKMYKRVLELTPKHVNTLYNYAVLLDTHLNKKSEGEEYYRQALEIEPRHAYALYNLAVLLEEKYANMGVYKVLSEGKKEKGAEDMRSEALEFYRRAAEADVRDATTLADYGRYMFVRMEDVGQAEPLLNTALKIDAGCDVALYHLAVLLYKEKRSIEKAEQLLRILLAKNSQHANGVLALARIVADRAMTLNTKVLVSNASSEKGFAELAEKKDKSTEEALNLYDRGAGLAKEVSSSDFHVERMNGS